MKSLIILVALLVLAEIQVTLSASDKSISEEHEESESEENEEEESSEDEPEPPATTDPLQLAFEKAAKNVRILRENKEKEFNDAYVINRIPLTRAKLITSVMRNRAHKKFEEATRRATDEYHQVELAANEKYKDAIQEYEAAEEELGRVLEQNKEKKRIAEAENQEILNKALKEKETVVKAAKKKVDQARDKVRNLSRSRVSIKERTKIKNELQEEQRKYQDTVRKAEDEYQKILKNLGRGNQEIAAEDEAVKKLEKAQEKINSMLQDRERTKTLEAAKMKEQEAIQQARAEQSEVEKECKKIMKIADENFDAEARRIWAKYNQATAQVNAEMKKLETDFPNFKNAGQLVYGSPRKSSRKSTKDE